MIFLITVIVVFNIFTAEYDHLGKVLSQEITFENSKSYTFDNAQYLPILSTMFFELIPLVKRVNELNDKRADKEKLNDPRPKIFEKITFDKAGNVTLSKEDHKELQKFVCDNAKV